MVRGFRNIERQQNPLIRQHIRIFFLNNISNKVLRYYLEILNNRKNIEIFNFMIYIQTSAERNVSHRTWSERSTSFPCGMRVPCSDCFVSLSLVSSRGTPTPTTSSAPLLSNTSVKIEKEEGKLGKLYISFSNISLKNASLKIILF